MADILAHVGDTTIKPMQDDDGGFEGEAPYIRETGRIGSVFALSGDPENHSLAIMDDIDTSDKKYFESGVWRYRTLLKRSDGRRCLLHPSGFAITENKLISNYHGLYQRFNHEVIVDILSLIVLKVL